jgi:threonine synthase
MASEVYRAYRGRDAVEIATREVPDLIVLDLMMPEMDGFEVVAALNANPLTAGIPVVIVTASTVTEDDRQRLNGFAKSVIGKAGFDSRQFIDEVRRVMTVAATAGVD